MASVIALPALADVGELAELEGRIQDSSGDPVAGVTVSLSGSRGQRAVSTDDDGLYRFAALVPDEYEVSVSLDGISKVSATTRVRAGERTRLDLDLDLMSSDAVEVVAEAPRINRFKAGASSSLIAETAEELTFRTRNFESSFTSFVGTVQSAGSQSLAETRPSVNGSQWQETAGYVDGVDTSNTRAGGSTRLFIPTTALAEIQLDGAGYGVAYGRSAGGVFNAVVKSGTNRFHGSMVYIPQSDSWRAQSEAVPLERSGEIKSSYELSFGGPIIRDRLWLFAAAAENTSNEIDAVADGTVFDNSLRQTSRILKLSAQPGERHHLSLTAIDAPVERVFWGPSAADRFTPADFDLNEKLLKVGWNWTWSRNLHLDVKAASYRSEVVRQAVEVRDVDPTASEDSPLGNQSRYFDQYFNLQYNALYLPSGPGSDEFPRDQASAAVDWALGRHDIEIGVDYQDVLWRSTNSAPTLYVGKIYDVNLPGGFETPITKRVFDPQEAPSETEARIVSLFAQDQWTPGNRWTLQLGLRIDDQRHLNDVGETAIDTTDLSPRLAAVYDASGDGRLLLKATVGRYLQAIPQNLVNQFLARRPNGFNSSIDYKWTLATQAYDQEQEPVRPDPTAIQSFDSYHKDEVTFGLDWSFGALWTATTRLIYWSLDDLYWANRQFDEEGDVFIAIRNYSAGERQYRGLQLALDRRLSDGWTIGANYTLSRLDGNIFPAGAVDQDSLFEGLGGVEENTGRTDATSVNRDGCGANDRTHNLNATLVRHWQLRRHTVTLGSFLMLRSGEPWGLTQSTTLKHPESEAPIQSITYLEPRGTQRLPSTFSLNLTGSWTLPLSDRFDARLRAEIANVTNEQQQIFVNPITGQPGAGRSSYQIPREFRLLAGIRF